MLDPASAIVGILSDRGFWAESAKLAAQLVGAFWIARLTVQWALKRFKSEKLWEKQLALATDAVLTIRDMRRIAYTHLNYSIDRLTISDSHRKELRELGQSTNEKLQSQRASTLILMPEIGAILDDFEAKIKSTYPEEDHGDPETFLRAQISIMDQTVDKLVAKSRALLADR